MRAGVEPTTLRFRRPSARPLGDPVPCEIIETECWHTPAPHPHEWLHSGYTMGMFWVHSGYILGTFWMHYWHDLDTLWIQSGYILGTFWIHQKHILDTPCAHSGRILDSFWIHAGYITCSFWSRSGYLRSTSWMGYVYILDALWVRPGHIPNTFWIHPRYLLDTSKVHPGYIQYTIGEQLNQIVHKQMKSYRAVYDPARKYMKCSNTDGNQMTPRARNSSKSSRIYKHSARKAMKCLENQLETQETDSTHIEDITAQPKKPAHNPMICLTRIRGQVTTKEHTINHIDLTKRIENHCMTTESEISQIDEFSSHIKSIRSQLHEMLGTVWKHNKRTHVNQWKHIAHDINQSKPIQEIIARSQYINEKAPNMYEHHWKIQESIFVLRRTTAKMQPWSKGIKWRGFLL